MYYSILYWYEIKTETEKFAILEFAYVDVFVYQLNNYHTNWYSQRRFSCQLYFLQWNPFTTAIFGC